MGQLSNFLENKLLDKSFRATDFTVTTAYVSLHTADPGETGASEVTGGSYARQAGTFGVASARGTDNTGNIDFVSMPAATVTHVGIWDAVSAGNFLWGGALDASKTTNSGDTFRFNTGELNVTIPAGAPVVISDYLANKILDKVLRNVDYTVTTVYVSLHTAAPGAGGASEVAGGSYARQSSTFDVASGGATANSGALAFAGMPAATLTHVGCFDALSAGNFLWASDLTPDKTTNSGDTFNIATGDLDLTID